MWWSTVVYFDRSESKMFFDTWAHIANNYDFINNRITFNKLFRTDYCVSIAGPIQA